MQYITFLWPSFWKFSELAKSRLQWKKHLFSWMYKHKEFVWSQCWLVRHCGEQFQNYHLWSIDSYIEIHQEYSLSYLGDIKNQPCVEFLFSVCNSKKRGSAPRQLRKEGRKKRRYNPNTSDTIKSMKALSIHAGCCYFELNRWSWAIPFALFLNLHKGHSTCSFEYKNIIVPHKSQNMKSPPRACAISMLLLSAAFYSQRN